MKNVIPFGVKHAFRVGDTVDFYGQFDGWRYIGIISTIDINGFTLGEGSFAKKIIGEESRAVEKEYHNVEGLKISTDKHLSLVTKVAECSPDVQAHIEWMRGEYQKYLKNQD